MRYLELQSALRIEKIDKPFFQILLQNAESRFSVVLSLHYWNNIK